MSSSWVAPRPQGDEYSYDDYSEDNYYDTPDNYDYGDYGDYVIMVIVVTKLWWKLMINTMLVCLPIAQSNVWWKL